MATPNLPTNINAGGTTSGHKSHTDTIHTMLNRHDNTNGTTGLPLLWDGTKYAAGNMDNRYYRQDLIDAAAYISDPGAGVDGDALVRAAGTVTWATRQFARMEHGTNAAAARPNAVKVEWIGSVEPDNAIEYDSLISTA